MFYVYKIENKIDRKVYIGQTKTPEKRWDAHKKKRTNKYLSAAIGKHKIENFEFSICEICNSQSEVDQAEISWIAKMRLSLGKENVYNANDGGSGNSGFKLTKPRIISPETRIKISKSLTGKKQSEETKTKRSNKLKGRKRVEEVRKNISNGKKGKKFSDEHIKNISIGHMGQIPWNKGTKGAQTAWNKGKLKILSNTEIFEINKLLLEGKSIYAIASILKIGRSVIKRFLSKVSDE
jgi:group I intron endonuclease